MASFISRYGNIADARIRRREQRKYSSNIDKKEVLNFLDEQPLHGKRGMEFIGFNIWAATRGSVSIYDLSIN